MEDYVERLQLEGLLDSDLRPTRLLNLGFNLPPPPAAANWVEDLSSGVDRAVPVPAARNAANAALPAEYELNAELKKIKKHLHQMVDLQKQANIMAAGFYVSIIVLFFFYLLFIRR